MLQLAASNRWAKLLLHGGLLPTTATAIASASRPRRCAVHRPSTLLPIAHYAQHQQARGLAQKRSRRRKRAATPRSHGGGREASLGRTGANRKNNLHPAAKMKRVLSACDYWFSDENLRSDRFLRREIRDFRGYVRISAIATFPKLRGWTDGEIILKALSNEACRKRYRVVFSRDMVEKVAMNRRRRRRNAKRREELLEEVERLTERLQSKIREGREMVEVRKGGDDTELRQDHLAEGKINGQRAEPARDMAMRGEADDAMKKVLDATGRNAKDENDYDDFDALGLVDDGTALEDEKLPSVIRDDGSGLWMHALVRHRRVTEDYLSDLVETEVEGDDPTQNDVDKEKSGEAEPAKANDWKSLKRYSSCRRVRVIENSKQLADFCRELNESIGSYEGERKAIGLDVEYCTLEMDIRRTLPAMLQLASPRPDGPTGLIWLDKFPNHGKDMMRDDGCNDLFSILDDGTIAKVGPGVSSDAKNLASWWGITEAEYVDHFFSGLVDMETEPDDCINEKSLQEMCAGVLERDLPKFKDWGGRRKKELRRRGVRVKTSHWRRGDLTGDMKKYAADDASCAVDVWLKVVEGRGANEHNVSLDAACA